MRLEMPQEATTSPQEVPLYFSIRYDPEVWVFKVWLFILKLNKNSSKSSKSLSVLHTSTGNLVLFIISLPWQLLAVFNAY